MYLKEITKTEKVLAADPNDEEAELIEVFETTTSRRMVYDESTRLRYKVELIVVDGNPEDYDEKDPFVLLVSIEDGVEWQTVMRQGETNSRPKTSLGLLQSSTLLKRVSMDT